MKPIAYIVLAAALGGLVGCNDDGVAMGPPPPAPEFTMNQSDPNNVIFTVTSAQGFMVNWDFGNGTLSKKLVDTVYFPFADSYSVSLAVSGRGGAAVTKKEVVIARTDPVLCANIYYTYLTGGCGIPSKTWVIPDADSAFGNGGPSPKDSLGGGTSSYDDKIVYWWNSDTAATPRIPDARSLDDEYVFALKGFVYKNESHGHFYFNWKWANKLFGATQATFADTIRTYIPTNPATWKLETVPEADTTGGKRAFFTDSATGKRFNLILHLSSDNYIGYGSGTSTYQILSITADKMFLRHELAEPDKPSVTGPNRLEWRYLNLVSK